MSPFLNEKLVTLLERVENHPCERAVLRLLDLRQQRNLDDLGVALEQRGEQQPGVGQLAGLVPQITKLDLLQPLELVCDMEVLLQMA